MNAGVEATGDNITICGRSILDCSDWEHNAGPTDYMINAKNCNNFVMKDVILKGAFWWTIVPQNCDRGLSMFAWLAQGLVMMMVWIHAIRVI